MSINTKTMNCRVYIRLREAILAYRRRTGERMTYEILASQIGLAKGTLQNIGSGRRHGANLSTIAKICCALDITPGDLLELERVERKPKTKRSTKKTRRK